MARLPRRRAPLRRQSDGIALADGARRPAARRGGARRCRPAAGLRRAGDGALPGRRVRGQRGAGVRAAGRHRDAHQLDRARRLGVAPGGGGAGRGCHGPAHRGGRRIGAAAGAGRRGWRTDLRHGARGDRWDPSGGPREPSWFRGVGRAPCPGVRAHPRRAVRRRSPRRGAAAGWRGRAAGARVGGPRVVRPAPGPGGRGGQAARGVARAGPAVREPIARRPPSRAGALTSRPCSTSRPWSWSRRAAGGCRVLWRNGSETVRLEVATAPVTAPDTTGAGDAFAAGFLRTLIGADSPMGEAILRRAALAGHRSAGDLLRRPRSTLAV